MAITAISYDWGVEPTMVRITTTDTLSTITTAGYWSDEAVAVAALNNGAFTFPEGCLIAINYSGGQNTFSYDTATLTFIPVVGQYISSVIALGGAVSLTSGVAADITTISLETGEWSVWGTVAYTSGATTNITFLSQWQSLVSATIPTTEVMSRISYNAATGIVVGLGAFSGNPIAALRLSLPSTTTVYLTARAGFTIDTLAGYGAIYASKVA